MYNAFKIVAAIVLVWIALSMGILAIGEILAPFLSDTTITADDGITGRYHLRGQTTQFFE